MNLKTFMRATRFAGDSAGKGTVGCLLFVLLFCIAAFIGARLMPVYFAFSSFETEVKTEASRAGANFYDDETVMKHILEIAKRNEIQIERDGIKIERIAGSVYISAEYSVLVDFMVYEYPMDFKVKAASLVGRL